MKCIFCGLENIAKAREHIVSESFGNKDYIIERGAVCDVCNNNLSKSEGKALTNSVFVMERARYGIVTKKGKNVKGSVAGIDIEGNSDFEEQKLTLRGLNENNVKDFDPKTLTFVLHVQSFDRSESATSRMLLKVGLESVFASRKNIFKQHAFDDLRNYLVGNTNVDWPFLTVGLSPWKFTSIPRFSDRYKLAKIHCSLEFFEFDDHTFLFKFRFGGVNMVLNLLNRNLDWIKKYLQLDEKAVLYPEHFRNKIANK